MDKKPNPSGHITTKRISTIKLSNKSVNRSKSNLTANDNNICYDNSAKKKPSQNITLERNGSLPNINIANNSSPVDEITQLQFAYDKYLSSLEAKYISESLKKKITLNINEQKRVFIEEFKILRNQLENARGELESKSNLIKQKTKLDKNIEVLEVLEKTIVFNKSDEEIMSLITGTASKVVLKNFKKLDETDLNAVNILLDEIMESVKQNYVNKINVRVQLKDVLIKMAMLTKELEKNKTICEELFAEEEILKDQNESLKILKAQFGENPDTTLLPGHSSLMDDIQNMFNETE